MLDLQDDILYPFGKSIQKKNKIAWVHLSWVFDGKMPPPDLNVQ